MRGVSLGRQVLCSLTNLVEFGLAVIVVEPFRHGPAGQVRLGVSPVQPQVSPGFKPRTGFRDRHGFERQEAACCEWAKEHRRPLTAVYRDAHTGTEADRPEWERMILDVRQAQAGEWVEGAKLPTE